MTGEKHPESDKESSDNIDTANQCVQGWKADDAQSSDINLAQGHGGR